MLKESDWRAWNEYYKDEVKYYRMKMRYTMNQEPTYQFLRYISKRLGRTQFCPGDCIGQTEAFELVYDSKTGRGSINQRKDLEIDHELFNIKEELT